MPTLAERIAANNARLRAERLQQGMLSDDYTMRQRQIGTSANPYDPNPPGSYPGWRPGLMPLMSPSEFLSQSDYNAPTRPAYPSNPYLGPTSTGIPYTGPEPVDAGQAPQGWGNYFGNNPTPAIPTQPLSSLQSGWGSYFGNNMRTQNNLYGGSTSGPMSLADLQARTGRNRGGWGSSLL